MANFPTTVYSPGSVSAGNTIQPSDINNPNAEIAAIEDGLRNGTAPLNSSNSTFNNLSVTAGSTFGGAVTFNGPVTFSTGIASTVSFASSVTIANLTVTGTLSAAVIAAAKPAIRVSSSGRIQVPNNAFMSPNWDVEDFTSTSGPHSTGTNSSRLNLTSTGIWVVGANAEWSTNTSGGRWIRIVLNDATSQGGVGMTALATAQQNPTQSVTALVHATSTTDYVTMQVLQTNGSTDSLGNSTRFGTNFWAYQVV